MNDNEQRSLLGLSLMAAFADGNRSDSERDRIRTIVEGFQNPALNALEMYRDVSLRRVTVRDLASRLTTPELRLQAYEMAVGVCGADGRQNEAESAFLAELQKELGIGDGTAAPLRSQAGSLADAAIPPVLGGSASAPTSAASTSVSLPPQSGGSLPAATEQELDSTILHHSILAGALEMLPGSLATMAIIPLQMRLVYRIGQQFGHQLDRQHIGEFLAAAGIGMTSQVLEGYATKFVKGLLGMVAGGVGRGIGGMFTGSALAFATTWAVGNLAKRYYAGGRSLSGMELQQTFQSLLGQARGLEQRYLPQIQQRSQGLNLAEVMRLAGR